jgi:single-strand DNA-binding protein
MANFNRVILAGNLTRDPQLSFLPSNTPVVDFGMAINRRWKAPDGQPREEVCFVDCRCYGRQAETLNQYVRKGRPLLVEGRLRYESWDGKDGQKRSRLSVVVDHFQFLDSRREGEAAASGARAAGPEEQPPAPEYDGPAPGSRAEEVPF